MDFLMKISLYVTLLLCIVFATIVSGDEQKICEDHVHEVFSHRESSHDHFLRSFTELSDKYFDTVKSEIKRYAYGYFTYLKTKITEDDLQTFSSPEEFCEDASEVLGERLVKDALICLLMPGGNTQGEVDNHLYSMSNFDVFQHLYHNQTKIETDYVYVELADKTEVARAPDELPNIKNFEHLEIKARLTQNEEIKLEAVGTMANYYLHVETAFNNLDPLRFEDVKTYCTAVLDGSYNIDG